MAKEAKQVNEAQFLKSMNRNKQAAAVAAKAERPVGMASDADILQRLGLEEDGDTVSLAGRVSKIQFGYAKQDTDRPFFRFAYSLSENSPNTDKGKGAVVSNYHELTEAGGEGWERTLEQAYERMFWEFQALGEDTKNWKDPNAEALKAAKKHTADKTEVHLTISAYAKKDGKLGMNVRVADVVAPEDNSDLEEEEEEYEDAEEGTEESSEDEEASYEDWIGGWVTWTDDEGSVDIKITGYDADSETFTGEDEDGSEYEGAPVDQCEWCDNQRDD